MEADSRLVAQEVVDLERSPTGEIRTRTTNHVMMARLERARPGTETYLSGIATGRWPLIYRIRKTSLPPRFSLDWTVLTEDGTLHDVTSLQPVAQPQRSDWMILTLVRREP